MRLPGDRGVRAARTLAPHVISPGGGFAQTTIKNGKLRAFPAPGFPPAA